MADGKIALLTVKVLNGIGCCLKNEMLEARLRRSILEVVSMPNRLIIGRFRFILNPAAPQKTFKNIAH